MNSVSSSVEEWRDVVGYEGLYAVSDHGRIRPLVYRGSKRPAFLSLTNRGDGYLVVRLVREPRKATLWKVHRLVLIAFRGLPDDQLLQAAHLNGNRADNRLANLMWATVTENARHRVLHGTQLRGQQSPISKLTEDQVLAIRREYAPRNPLRDCRALGRRFGVNATTVSAIVNRKTWQHI